MSERASSRRFLGITVLGDFILSEGVEPILENLHRVGATAVACNPTVTAAAAEGTGSFQPPSDAGTSPRLFDRPLFGRRALWVRSGVSYRPNAEFYSDSPYLPRQPNELTDAHGEVIARFVEAAADSGLRVYFQIGAAQPSGLRDEDRPRLPNGELPPNRMADTASLASPAVRAYNRAYVADLLAAYPRISGFRPDWPEYPCYTLGEVFQDFSPHVRQWAETRGYDFEAIRREVASLYEFLHGGLTNDHLRHRSEGGSFFVRLLFERPRLAEWLRIKSELSADLLREWREAITEHGGRERELAVNAFMPPYAVLTGIGRIDQSGWFHWNDSLEQSDMVSPKLYTMHWSLMVRFWGEELLRANPGLDERLLVRALADLMDLSDEDGTAGETLADYGYPEPDEPHPIPDFPQRQKIAQVIAAVEGKAAVCPLVHGYGPPDDFARRLQLVADSPAEGVWINRYGYLSDEKLDRIAAIWS